LIISISANLTALFCVPVNPVELNVLSSNWTAPETVTVLLSGVVEVPPDEPPPLPQEARTKK